MNENQVGWRPRNSMYALIVSFAGVFVFGFLPGAERLFLLPLFCLALAAAAVLSSATTVRVRRERPFLLLAGLGAATFVAGVLYGTFGMMGFYEINDLVYLTVVVGSGLGTVVGAAGSLATYSQAADNNGRDR